MADISYNALDVANAFLATAQKEGRSLTNLQLQKLVYIAYGYFAGLMNDSLFPDDIEAWDYGPVIPTLYHHLKKYGVGAVTEPLPSHNKINGGGAEVKVVEGVWDSYKKYSPIELADLTHKDGTPWKTIREKTKGRKHVSIPFALIREHYEKLIRERMREH